VLHANTPFVKVVLATIATLTEVSRIYVLRERVKNNVSSSVCHTTYIRRGREKDTY
jgi:hypothetical protein